MHKKIKGHIILVSFLVSIVMLTGLGCKGVSKDLQEATKSVTLNYWTVFDDLDQLRTFAQEYSALHSYVTINIRQVRYEEFDSLFANALADDVAPDVVSMHSRWLRQYQNRLDPAPESVSVANIRVEGQLQPKTIITIENNLMPSKNFVRRSYISAVADDIIIDDEIYGYPLSMDTLALFYNKELLDKAGVPVAPKTWDDFSAASKKGTIYGSDGKVIQAGVALGTGNNIDNAFDIISLLMMQNNIVMERSGRISFNDGLGSRSPDHPALQSVRFYTDFARPTKDIYSWDRDMGNALDNFAQGKSVFFFGFAYDRPRIKARGPQIKLQVEPVPQLNPTTPVNVANYWVESVVSKSPNKNEAWDFVRFMSTPENVKRYVEATQQPSPLREQIVEQQEDPALGPFAFQALTAVSWYHGKDFEAAKQAFNNMFNSYLEPYGERDDPVQRDSGLIDRAARVIQQTL